MTIEESLASIAKSLAILAENAQDVMPDVETQAQPAPAQAQAQPAPVYTPPAPVPMPPPIPAPPVPPAPPTVPPSLAPFTDSKGVMAYCMNKYKELGPVKGGGIQSILSSLGHTNINNLRPEQYGSFYAAVEAL